MKLTVPIINELKKSLKTNDVTERDVEDYFHDGSKGRLGYYAKQLMSKHGIPFRDAVFASAFLNLRIDRSDAAVGLDPLIKRRLDMCILSFSYFAKYETACKLKRCPLCRALTVLRVNRLLDHLPASRMELQEELVVQSLPKLPRRPGALLTVRNVVKKDNSLVLRQLLLYPSPSAPTIYKEPVLDLLRYDFALTSDKPLLDLWLEITKGMKFYSRARKFG